jgi:predicted amidohydrolase YtcJ
MQRYMAPLPAAIAAIILASFFLPGCKAFPRADGIFINGHIVTMNSSLPEAQAFAVGNGRIAAVGTNEKIRRAYPDIPPVDLRRRTVMPGIVESHGHLLDLGRSFIEVSLEGVKTPEEAIERVQEHAARTPPGEWITGWGWDEGAWAGAYPDHEKLSRATPHHPVWLRGLHGFAGWANAKALEIGGITKATANPKNGEILRNPKTGNPTGILTNEAQALVTRHIPPLSEALMERALTLAGEECLSYGLTTVHDAKVTRPMLQSLRFLAARGRLKPRVYAMLDAADGDLIEPFLAHGPEIDPEHWLTVRCIKIFADGSLGARGAALEQAYSDDPGARGALNLSQEEIFRLTSRALQAGLQVAVHAIGDRANRTVLDAYEAALRQAPAVKNPRLRIEHAQVIAPQDILRCARLGILASMQPPHCTSDMPWAEARVGPERIREAYAWRSFLNAGVRVTLNSDFPGETPNPFWGMYAAETRQTPAGLPEGGWHAEQCLRRNETLRGYTTDAAYAGFQEHLVGQIAPGMLADFIVLSGDITTMPAKRLLTLRVEQTFLGGNLVYRRSR